MITEKEAKEAERRLKHIVNLGVRMAMAKAGFKNAKTAALESRIGEDAFRAYLQGKNTWNMLNLARFSLASGISIEEVLRIGESAWASQQDAEAMAELHLRRLSPEKRQAVLSRMLDG